jgi:sugar phosphate isomerase/epimerase
MAFFSKHLGDLPLAEAGQVIQDLGFERVDLTVRPGGHVLPRNARSELLAAVRMCADLGLEVPLITTGITSAEDPFAVDIFKVAGEAGIPNLKLGYWPYEAVGTLRALINDIALKLDGIEAIARRTGVRTVIHNHSGNYVSALAPVVWDLIADRDPAAIGAYVDPAHLVIEGGLSGWKMSLDLLGDRIAVAAFKDYVWEIQRDKPGKAHLARVATPLSHGMVPWQEVVSYLRQLGFDGWVSLHREYGGSNVAELRADVSRDLAYLTPILDAIQ